MSLLTFGAVAALRSRSSSSGPQPSVAACSRQSASSPVGSTGRGGRRVASVAAAAAAGPATPSRSSSASISTRRFENQRHTRRGTPATSATSFVTGVHSKPRRRVSSSAQHRLEHSAGDALRSVQGVAVQRRPAPVRSPCRVGHQQMPVQLRITGPARAMPELGRHEPQPRQPTCPPRRRVGDPACRLFVPRRTKQASRSNQPNVWPTAASPAATTSCRTSGSPKAYTTDTDLGTENVKSNPGTRRGCGHSRPPFRDNPAPGARPASSAWRSSPDTSPVSASAPAAWPVQTPATSPLPA